MAPIAAAMPISPNIIVDRTNPITPTMSKSMPMIFIIIPPCIQCQYIAPGGVKQNYPLIPVLPTHLDRQRY